MSEYIPRNDLLNVRCWAVKRLSTQFTDYDHTRDYTLGAHLTVVKMGAPSFSLLSVICASISGLTRERNHSNVTIMGVVKHSLPVIISKPINSFTQERDLFSATSVTTEGLPHFTA